MVRFAVGYRSRAIVTFGRPIPLDATIRTRGDRSWICHTGCAGDGRIYKVLPTAVVAAGDAAFHHAGRSHRTGRLASSIRFAPPGEVDVPSGEEAVEAAAEPFGGARDPRVEDGRFRVRERNVLRYYAAAIEHLLRLRAPRTERRPIFACSTPRRRPFSLSRPGHMLQRLASRYGMRAWRFARRFIAGETSRSDRRRRELADAAFA